MFVVADKNPHPNAQEAFELLSRAYEQLTDPELRAAVDSRIAKQRSLKHFFTRQQRKINNWMFNFKSNFLLFLYSKDQVGFIREYVRLFIQRLVFVLEAKYYSVVLAPTNFDRLQVAVLEPIWDNKFSSVVLLYSILKILILSRK